MRSLFLSIQIFWLLLLCNHLTFAQSSVIDPYWHQELVRTEAFITSFKNDSALIVVQPIIKILEEEAQLDSPFGLEVQLAEVTALDADGQEDKALRKLLYIRELSKEKARWKTYTKTCIILALLYEKSNQPQSCFENLQNAKSNIQKHQFFQLYPRLAVRMASYYLVFKISRDSALYYGEETLRSAQRYGLKLDEGHGHLMLGFLFSKTNYQQANDHLTTAARIYEQLQIYTLQSAMYRSLSQLHYQNNQPDLALVYNDSAIIISNKAIASGAGRHSILHNSFKLRANIYRTLGEFDSAWYYLDKGHEVELDFIKKDNQNKVFEIESLYQNEKKTQQIEAQTQELGYEKRRKNWLLMLGGMILVLSLILVYYYVRLHKVNHKINDQARIIGHTNEKLSVALEQQVALQGEIHHRVKNNLQVIISLLELQTDEIQDPQALKNLESMSNRIFSMSAIHELLYKKKGEERLNFEDYTLTLCQHIASFLPDEQQVTFEIQIPELYFNLATSMPLGIIINELLTNTLKYARIPAQILKISIQIKPSTKGYMLCYQDNGPGFPNGALEERESGLGSYLLKSMSRQLDGRLESTNQEGAFCRISFKEKYDSVVSAAPIEASSVEVKPVYWFNSIKRATSPKM